MEISLFVRTEEAPALNFLIRVLTPIVFLIIVSTVLYNYGLDNYVENIYFVNIYYIVFRLIFNLFTNRGLLLNWYRQSIYWSSIIIISYFTYIKLIKQKENILPDFTTVANELWIIILIFIFQIINNVRISSDSTIKRKETYLKARYNHFKNLYGNFISNKTKNDILECLVYAIIIYEDFNRPKIVRFIENLKFRITKKPHTLGVMQVRSAKIITDKESVALGIKKVKSLYKKCLKDIDENTYEYSIMHHIITGYNGGSSYHDQITELADQIKDNFYKHTKDTLSPFQKIE